MNGTSGQGVRGDGSRPVIGGLRGSPPEPQSAGQYRGIALSNTTLSMTMATIDASIVIVAMPAIFRGIGLNPLTPAT